jgi:rhodanese-related sulfurtransferase
MNPLFVVALVAVAIVFFMAFKGIRQSNAFSNLDVKSFAEKIMKDKEVIILDVRTPAEFAEGAIKGAINIDVNASNFKEKVSTLDKEKSYLIYCRSGMRSVKACNLMAENGFNKMFNLLGGYQAWSSNIK